MAMVDLALTPDVRWSASTTELVLASSSAGFAALGVSARRVDSAAYGSYRAAGLRCHELLALIVSDDAEVTVGAAGELAAAAELMGAEWVLAVFRCALTSSTAAIIRECAAVFADVGAGMAVEFSPIGPISSIRAGLEVVDVAAAGGRAGLVIDSWHFCLSESTPKDLKSVPLDTVAYVQFADALPPVGEDLIRETMDRRAVPGEGVLDLRGFASTLLDRGWNGLVSVEVLNTELQPAPTETVVPRIYAATRSFWS
jgi:sugar phosphate isomerase/epimerase